MLGNYPPLSIDSIKRIQKIEGPILARIARKHFDPAADPHFELIGSKIGIDKIGNALIARPGIFVSRLN
jgi:hypothetical protein